MTDVRVLEADLADPAQADAVLAMVDAYARDETANGAPLSDEVKRALIPGLRAHPGTIVLLAWDGAVPVGVAVCFLGFSTFAAKPLLNIHDLAVVREHRGRGISLRLLERADAIARARGCCKITLEVLANNDRARAIYQRFGFADYQLDEKMGAAHMMQKKLD